MGSWSLTRETLEARTVPPGGEREGELYVISCESLLETCNYGTSSLLHANQRFFDSHRKSWDKKNQGLEVTQQQSHKGEGMQVRHVVIYCPTQPEKIHSKVFPTPEETSGWFPWTDVARTGWNIPQPLRSHYTVLWFLPYFSVIICALFINRNVDIWIAIKLRKNY